MDRILRIISLFFGIIVKCQILLEKTFLVNFDPIFITIDLNLYQLQLENILEIDLEFNGTQGNLVYCVKVCPDSLTTISVIPSINDFFSSESLWFDYESQLSGIPTQQLTLTTNKYDDFIMNKFKKIQIGSYEEKINLAIYPKMIFAVNSQANLRVMVIQKNKENQCLSECSMHGSCRSDTNICSCLDGWTGKNCSLKLSFLDLESTSLLKISPFSILRNTIILPESVRPFIVTLESSNLSIFYQVDCMNSEPFHPRAKMNYFKIPNESENWSGESGLSEFTRQDISDCMSNATYLNSKYKLDSSPQLFIWFVNPSYREGVISIKVQYTSEDSSDSINLGDIYIGVGVSVGVLMLILCIIIQIRKCIRSRQRNQIIDIQIEQIYLSFMHLQAQNRIQNIEKDNPSMKYFQILRKYDGVSEIKECIICLGEFKDFYENIRFTVCCHLFHQTCLDQWLKTQESCPQCRGILIKQVNSQNQSLEKSNQYQIRIKANNQNLGDLQMKQAIVTGHTSQYLSRNSIKEDSFLIPEKENVRTHQAQQMEEIKEEVQEEKYESVQKQGRIGQNLTFNIQRINESDQESVQNSQF